MKKLILALTVLSSTLSQAAVICGETVDTSKIIVRDNYLNGHKYRNKAFMTAELFIGLARTNLCEVNGVRYLIIKSSNQPANDPSNAYVYAFPIDKDAKSSWN